jgi:hypothetical protein
MTRGDAARELAAALETIDWGAMRHAYGPADDVPDLLRGLLSDDAEEREIALDGFYTAVHHQGDVYDCTIACIPFLLCVVGDPAVAERDAVLALLASIGGVEDAPPLDVPLDRDDTGDDDDREYRRSQRQNRQIAHRAILAGMPIFLALLADEDSAVRRKAPLALRACWDEGASIVPALRRRFAIETDREARIACLKAIVAFCAKADPSSSFGPWLADLARSHAEPAVRLVALELAARATPAELPSDVAAIALTAVREVYDGARRDQGIFSQASR